MAETRPSLHIVTSGLLAIPFVAITLVLPAFGAWIAVAHGNTAGFLLMLPLLIYMEAGFGIGVIMLLIAAFAKWWIA